MTILNEEQIERRLERRIDAIDAMYMAGKISDAAYKRKTDAANAEADRAYDELAYSYGEPAMEERIAAMEAFKWAEDLHNE